jgi:hypothetical protein
MENLIQSFKRLREKYCKSKWDKNHQLKTLLMRSIKDSFKAMGSSLTPALVVGNLIYSIHSKSLRMLNSHLNLMGSSPVTQRILIKVSREIIMRTECPLSLIWQDLRTKTPQLGQNVPSLLSMMGMVEACALTSSKIIYIKSSSLKLASHQTQEKPYSKGAVLRKKGSWGWLIWAPGSINQAHVLL